MGSSQIHYCSGPFPLSYPLPYLPSQCNRVCGLGQQTRTVYCLARHPLPDAASDILPSGRCHPADEPISAQECNEGPCDGLEWVVSSWSGVSIFLYCMSIRKVDMGGV